MMEVIIKFLLITIVVLINEFECKDRQSCGSQSPPNMVQLAMTKENIVPDIIGVSPKSKLQVRFPSGFDANLGNELTPLSVKDRPILIWPFHKNRNYTLIMVDIDVPTRKAPTSRSFKHWIVINIPGNNIDQGQILDDFIGSAPPEGTGLHRYVLLVFKQSKYLEFDTPVVPFSIKTSRLRANFNVSQFVKDNELGRPVAGNFYLSQSDQYSEELWAKWNREA